MNQISTTGVWEHLMLICIGNLCEGGRGHWANAPCSTFWETLLCGFSISSSPHPTPITLKIWAIDFRIGRQVYTGKSSLLDTLNSGSSHQFCRRTQVAETCHGHLPTWFSEPHSYTFYSTAGARFQPLLCHWLLCQGFWERVCVLATWLLMHCRPCFSEHFK